MELIPRLLVVNSRRRKMNALKRAEASLPTKVESVVHISVTVAAANAKYISLRQRCFNQSALKLLQSQITAQRTRTTASPTPDSCGRISAATSLTNRRKGPASSIYLTKLRSDTVQNPPEREGGGQFRRFHGRELPVDESLRGKNILAIYTFCL